VNASSPPPVSTTATPHHISGYLRRLIEISTQEATVTVGRILEVFGVRGFALLFLILSILNIVIFIVPFLSFFLGLPMVLLAAQIVLGMPTPVFPKQLLERSFSGAALAEGVGRAIPWIEKLERYIKPRLMVLSDPAFARLHGLFALILSIMVTLPIPVINVPPSVAILMLAIGILERDGIFIAVGYGIGLWCFWLFRSIGHLAHSVGGLV
jgi:hypothetical protein